jgi:hypothetical protein
MTKESGFDAMMKRIKQEDQEILKELGSDFDEEGVPYWKKWGKGEKAKFDAEFPIDKTQH